MAIIYKITNQINQKVYIGQTIRGLNVRWNEHKHEAFKEGHGFLYPIHSAMRKYGIENFTIEILEMCDDEKRHQKESEYIAFYNSLDKEFGYNLVAEGTGRLLYPSEKIKELWEKGLGIQAIANELGCYRGVVSKRLRGLGYSEEEIKKQIGRNSSLRQGLPLYQYDLKGNFIKLWESASECARQTGYSQTAIASVTRQEQHSAYGFLWKLASDERPIEEWVNKNIKKGIGGKPKKKIGQYDLNTNELIKIYNSGAEAAKALGVSDKSKICRAARLNGRSTGFRWKYIEGEKNE